MTPGSTAGQGHGPINSSLAAGPSAVTATSSLTLIGPTPLGGATYGWVVFSNVSPWVATVTGADGVATVQPFMADLFHTSGSGQIQVVMSVPPGGSSVAPGDAYVQADWYLSGSAPPDGTYPVSLTAQALLSQAQDTLLASVPPATLVQSVTLPANSQTIEVLFPSGTASTTATVVGNTTSVTYGGLAEFGQGARFRFRVSYAADPAVTVTVTNPGSTWFVVASPAVLQVDALPYGVAGPAGIAISAVPFSLQVAGNDGFNLRPVSTDSAGRLVPAPAVSTADSTIQTLTTTALNVAFGPTNTAMNLDDIVLFFALTALTNAAVGIVDFSVQTFGGTILHEFEATTPTTLPAGGYFINLPMQFPKGLMVAAAGVGNQQLKLVSNFLISTPTVFTGRARAIVHYT